MSQTHNIHYELAQSTMEVAESLASTPELMDRFASAVVLHSLAVITDNDHMGIDRFLDYEPKVREAVLLASQAATIAAPVFAKDIHPAVGESPSQHRFRLKVNAPFVDLCIGLRQRMDMDDLKMRNAVRLSGVAFSQVLLASERNPAVSCSMNTFKRNTSSALYRLGLPVSEKSAQK
jgi:hypothetical protein